MSTIKVKGNWNQQKGKLKMHFSNFGENEDLYLEEEEILGTNNPKRPIKKPGSKKEHGW